MGSPTCGDLLKVFSEFLFSEKGYSQSTLRCYRHDLTEFIDIAAEQCMRLDASLAHPAAIRPDQIDPLTIRQFPSPHFMIPVSPEYPGTGGDLSGVFRQATGELVRGRGVP